MIIAQAGQVAQTMNADVKVMEITPTQALTIVELLSTSHILFVLVISCLWSGARNVSLCLKLSRRHRANESNDSRVT